MKRRLCAIFSATAFLLLCCLLPGGVSWAEEEVPNLPLLLVNDSIYPQDFNL